MNLTTRLEDIRGSEGKSDSETRYSHGNYTELISSCENINWEKEFPSQNIEHCYGRFCEPYNDGLSREVPLAVNREEGLEKKEG